MIRWNTPLVHAVVASAIVACPLMAQKQDKAAAAPASKCTIVTDKPDEVKSAMNAVMVAQLGGRPEDQQKKLRLAVSSLTKSASSYKNNQVGHDYVLGQTLVRWAQQFPESVTVSKGSIGYADNKDQRVDLLVAADSLFSEVEKSNPDCTSETASYRSEAMRPLAIRASSLLNGDSLPQSDSVVKRIVIINGKSPLGLYFQGMVAQRHKDVAGAAEAYSKGLAALPPDVAADSNLKAALELNAAQMTLLSAQAQTGDQKKAGMLKAADLYKRFLADFPKSENAASAQAGLTAALGASGDTQSLSQLWDDMTANPSKYSDGQLYDAGTQAFTANQPAAASKLMDAAQTVNPWLRQGLYNAANVYWKAGQFDKMLPAAKRLTIIDPNNPDEYQLLALAYQGMAKSSKDPKVAKAYNDSLNAAFAASEKVPVRVSFDKFSGAGSAKRTVSGAVENLGTAPKNVTLKLDFLDAKGTVVATQSTALSLAPKEKKSFTVAGDGATIVAYKYDPIT
jgi:tetratricopeptide (TPR) repeat protein